jgi:dienelactone hydrolase
VGFPGETEGALMVTTPHARRADRVLVALVVLAGLVAVGCATQAEPPAHIRLHVSELTSLYDASLDIRVTGLNAGDRTTLQLESSGRQWSARATFDARGSVLNLDTAAPTSGSYRGVHGMGLFEALASRHPEGLFQPSNPAVFTLTASVRGTSSVTVRLTRELTGPGVRCVQLNVAANGFYGLYCAPAPHTGRRPPVLVFGGSEGGLATANTAELLASRGFPALALAYFDEPGLPDALDQIPLEYFIRAADWLAAQPGVDAEGLAVWGDSRGSEAALLLGAYFPGVVHAVIAGSPSSVINGAVSLTQQVPPTDSAWTLDGQPLPVAAPYGDPASTANPAAVIPVQKIAGPILLLVGADDQLWPSPAYARAIMTRLDKDHDPYAHQDLVFPHGGHLVGAAFPYDVGPTTLTTPISTLYLGGTPFDNSVAVTSAWHHVLAFLGHLS